MAHNFYFPFKNPSNLERRRFQRVPFQYSQVVAFPCKTANIKSASSSSTKPNHFLSTDNSLFSSGNDSDSVGSKENGSPAPETNAASKQVPTGAAVGGGGSGLFDEEEEDDDFFSGKSLKKSDSGKCVRIDATTVQVQVGSSPSNPPVFPLFSAGQKKPKKAVDLFDEDNEDGDIFSEKYSASTPAQSKKEVVEEQVKPPEKKVKRLNAVEHESIDHFMIWFGISTLCFCGL